MVISKRERYIAISTTLLVGGFLLYKVILSPLDDQKRDLDMKIADAQGQITKANHLFKERKRANAEFRDMVTGGLRKDGSQAETLVQQSILDWAQEAGFNLISLSPDRAEPEKGFSKKTFRAAGSGSMAQVGRFLWRIQTSPIPIHISEIQLRPRKDATTDDLSLTVGISTIYLAADQKPPAPANAKEEM
jgi:hypothetical protein